MERYSVVAIVLCAVYLMHCRSETSLFQPDNFLGCVRNFSTDQLFPPGRPLDECLNFSRIGVPPEIYFSLLQPVDVTLDLFKCYSVTDFPFTETLRELQHSLCSTPCPGDPEVSCGGPDGALAAYAVTNLTCIDPGIPSNGSRSKDGFPLGSLAKYNCTSGFELVGSRVSQCVFVNESARETGWSSPLPECVVSASIEPTTATVPIQISMPPRTRIAAMVGAIIAVIISVIVVVVVIIFVTLRKHRKGRANITQTPALSLKPDLPRNSGSQAKLTQNAPPEGTDIEEDDYLVPDAIKVSIRDEKGSTQSGNLHSHHVDTRPRLPAPHSAKVNQDQYLRPEESAYQNSLSIVLSRSRENVKEAVAKSDAEAAYQNRDVVSQVRRLKSGEGAPKGKPRHRPSSGDTDSGQIYENSMVSIPRSAARLSGGSRTKEDTRRGSAPQVVGRKPPLNERASLDYVTPNDPRELVEDEVYENTGVRRPGTRPIPSPGQARRPPLNQPTKDVAVDESDSDGVYLDILS